MNLGAVIGLVLGLVILIGAAAIGSASTGGMGSLWDPISLAIAYGRRGSIYYMLGDNRRATLNWNVALQLDPEFTEIYDILQAADENRLTPVEIEKKQENIK